MVPHIGKGRRRARRTGVHARAPQVAARVARDHIHAVLRAVSGGKRNAQRAAGLAVGVGRVALAVVGHVNGRDGRAVDVIFHRAGHSVARRIVLERELRRGRIGQAAVGEHELIKVHGADKLRVRRDDHARDRGRRAEVRRQELPAGEVESSQVHAASIRHQRELRSAIVAVDPEVELVVI